MNSPKVVLLLLLLCPNFLWSQKEKTTVEDRLQEVKSLVDSAQFDRALQLNRQVLTDYSSKQSPIDTQMARIHNSMSLVFLNRVQPDSGLIHSDRALEYLSKEPYAFHAERSRAFMYKGLGYERLGRLDESLAAYQNALPIIEQAFGEYHIRAISLYINLSICYNLKGEPKTAIAYLEKTLRILLNEESANMQQVAFVYNNLGGIYSTVEDYDKARTYHLKSYEIIREIFGPNHPHLFTSYINIGLNTLKRGDFEESRIYMLKALSIVKEHFGLNHPNNAVGHGMMGMIYAKSKNFLKAIEHYEEGLKVSQQNFGPRHYRVAEIYFNLAEAHTHLKNYAEAIRYTKKSQQIFLNDLGQNSKRVAQSNMILGNIYSTQGKHDQAIEYYERALNFYTSQSLKRQDLAKPYLYIGKSHSHKKEFAKANAFFTKSARILQYDFKQPASFAGVTNLVVLKELLKEKRDDYTRQHQIFSKEKYLDSIQQNDHQALALEDYFQSELSEQKARSFYLADDFWRYEKAIENLLQRAGQVNVNEAFTIAEKSKARLLTESFRSTRAKKILGVSEKLLEQERQLNVDLTYYDQKLFQEQYDMASPNDSIVDALQSHLFELKQQKESLVNTFQKEYPGYHQLKYVNEVVSISDIQSLLQNDQALVEYLVGDSTLFIFVITQDKAIVKSIKKDFPLEQWVKDFRESIYSYWMLPGQSDSSYQKYNASYAKGSFALYQKLIAPIASLLPEKLIIIPDGALNFMPFAALLSELPEDANAHQEHAYLLKQHQISYNYSANLFKELSEKKASYADRQLLAFAPTFEKAKLTNDKLEELRNGFGHLKYNLAEARTVQALFGGDLLQGDQATEDRFMQMADQYRVIHLSTHGKSNDQMGDYSFIAFSEIPDSTADNERLYVRELYNLELNADMVVLSACETGLGEMKRGEGIIGLARGFTYAGAASTITSLWSVNDIQTTHLMKRFYENIKAGMTKDRALRQAKLSYLEEENHVDPYFWSAFVASGNMAPINFKNERPKWYMSMGVLGIALFGLLFWRITKAAKSPRIPAA